jgi:antitoxin VapB
MPITRIFRNGNSQAIRIHAEPVYAETQTEVEIERIGDELRIRPVRRSLAGALDRFARFAPDFMAQGRENEEQRDSGGLLMPRYMFDTNMCVYPMRNQPEAIARRLAQGYVADVIMSSVT